MHKEQIQVGEFYTTKAYPNGPIQVEVLALSEDGIGVLVKVWYMGLPKLSTVDGEPEQKSLLIHELKQIPFSDYEVHGCAEFTDAQGIKFTEQVEDSEAQFFSLYGIIPYQGLECIGDFKTREAAEVVLCRITNT